MPQDPYAAYGGSVASQAPSVGADPYAAYGGQMQAAPQQSKPLARLNPGQPAGLPPGVSLPGIPAHAPVNMTAPTLSPTEQGVVSLFPDPGAATPSSSGHGLVGNARINTRTVPADGSQTQSNIPFVSQAKAALQNFGGAAARTLVQPLVHPSDTLEGIPRAIASAATNPVAFGANMIQPTVQDFSDNGAGVAIPHLLGNAAGSLLQGEFAKPLVAAASPLIRGAGKAAEFAAATPQAQTVAATRALVPGAPEDLLTRSLKPSVAYPGFEDSLTSSLPAIEPNFSAGSGVAGFRNAANAAKTTEQTWFNNLKGPYGNDPINTNSIVDSGVSSIPATDRFLRPGIVGATEDALGRFDSTPRQVTTNSPILDEFGRPYQTTQTVSNPMPSLDDVDAMRKDTNLKGRAAIFQKAGGDRAAALSNPTVARLGAVNSGLRDLEYSHLSDSTGVPVDQIQAQQSLFGDLSDVSDVANKRNTVFGRQNPYSLGETLAFNHGVNPLRVGLDFLSQRLLKGLTDSDALTNAAMDRFANPGSPALPARPGVFPTAVSAVGRFAQTVPAVNPFTLPAMTLGSQGARNQSQLGNGSTQAQPVTLQPNTSSVDPRLLRLLPSGTANALGLSDLALGRSAWGSAA